MPKYVTTFGSYDGDESGKKAAQKDQEYAAQNLTEHGHGSTMFAKVEKKAGDWQVNIYRR